MAMTGPLPIAAVRPPSRPVADEQYLPSGMDALQPRPVRGFNHPMISEHGV